MLGLRALHAPGEGSRVAAAFDVLGQVAQEGAPPTGRVRVRPRTRVRARARKSARARVKVSPWASARLLIVQGHKLVDAHGPFPQEVQAQA